ncbi:MAG: hypothetical protein OH319_02405 [Candidatus Parvarchaeota archaeon]|nr:hypothetical protein [Candidatus Jingweiarchaeum tengchongense]MCW1298219.1 hypothetical protein [Candidatus Jingweiarchaeum tengchongense]MCW1300017.1 hypothetical protein [Candidatus Jingweiarchaeum tengchongense]MCW1304844.1 hypothetical protein [Candidatus Jingweiarchaeum tengchongense]MCW1305434.1 hypothetical protein [Candidatus Jingweiarchaeum tengchongense]
MAKREGEDYTKDLVSLYNSILSATEELDRFPRSYDEAADVVKRLQETSQRIIEYGKGKPKQIQQITTQLSKTPLELANQISSIYGLGVKGEIAVEEGTKMLKQKEKVAEKWPEMIKSLRTSLSEKIKQIQKQQSD